MAFWKRNVEPEEKVVIEPDYDEIIEEVKNNDKVAQEVDTNLANDIFGDISPVEEEDVEKKDIWESDKPEEINVSFEGVGDYYLYTEDAKKTVEGGILIDTDIADLEIGNTEDEYKAKVFVDTVKPILEETADRAIGETIKFHNEKTRLDVEEALHEEFAYRMGKYERRRQMRKTKEIIYGILRVALILFVIAMVWSYEPLRDKVIQAIINLFDIVQGMINGEPVDSNKFFIDLFK